MPKEKVLRVMGEGVTYARVRGPFGRYAFTNPFRSEAAVANDGSNFEILYYATENRGWREFEFDSDELTPIVLKNGMVVGWGRRFFDEAVQKYEIRIS